MTENEIYIVSTSWYEEYDPTIFVGPKVDDWERFCLGVVQDSAKKCLASAGKSTSITTSHLKERLLKDLGKLGYKQLKPKEFNIWGGIICNDGEWHRKMIDNGELECIDEIEKHNKAAEELIHRSRQKHDEKKNDPNQRSSCVVSACHAWSSA